jgi:hypothetical protein
LGRAEEIFVNQSVRRIGYVFLCALPFVDLVVVSARPLRTAGVPQVVGVVLFTAVALAAWVVGPRVIRLKEAGSGKLAFAGFLLILPWAIIALLWVGLGAPFQATLSENHMRYLVLVWASIVVTIGFVVLNDALHESGERFYSTIGFAAALLAGAAYLICLNLSLAMVAMALRGDETPPPALLGSFYSATEFVACVMTYVTTAAFAVALWQVRFLGRSAALGYVTVSAILVLLIVMRGLAFPEISAKTEPLYTRPGVIAGIPAIPWLMPGLLGAVLLRRAGDAHP